MVSYIFVNHSRLDFSKFDILIIVSIGGAAQIVGCLLRIFQNSSFSLKKFIYVGIRFTDFSKVFWSVQKTNYHRMVGDSQFVMKLKFVGYFSQWTYPTSIFDPISFSIFSFSLKILMEMLRKVIFCITFANMQIFFKTKNLKFGKTCRKNELLVSINKVCFFKLWNV